MIDKTSHEAFIEIKNISLNDCNYFKINDFFILIKENEKTILNAKIKIEEKPKTNSAPTILMNALLCAFPDVLVSTSCKITDVDFYEDFWKPNILFSYYGYTTYESKSKKQIKVDDLNRLKKWHEILVEHNEICHANTDFRGTSWNVGFNEYLDASSCGIVEKSFSHLITALEALLIKGNDELNYRVALYTAILMDKTPEERSETFIFIKKCYNLRSKAVHGDAEGLKKNFKKEEVYEMLFDLKSIVSNILFKTYKKDKDYVITAIEKALYSCPSVII